MNLFEKLLSGRFIATLVVMAVYAYCAVNNIIDTDFIKTITLVVLYAYFSKDRSNRNLPDADITK
jgi:hypothetical protein